MNSPILTRLILIRHGQIQANVDKLWHGSTDSPLTEEGREQAARVGKRIQSDYPQVAGIYASPLQRTFNTAQAVADATTKPLKTHAGLREYGIGDLEGTSFAELAKEHLFFERLSKDPNYAPDNGESLHQVRDRVTDAFHEIARSHPGEDVVIVSHGAALALALGQLLHDDPYAWDKYQFKNTSVTELHYAPDLALPLFNCTLHLEI